MKKIICDLCKINEASRKFKVKQSGKFEYKPFGCGPDIKSWKRIDICGECYQKLFDIHAHRRLMPER